MWTLGSPDVKSKKDYLDRDMQILLLKQKELKQFFKVQSIQIIFISSSDRLLPNLLEVKESEHNQISRSLLF